MTPAATDSIEDAAIAKPPPSAAIYFRMFSPYQIARINAAGARMPVTGIEGARRSKVYAWEPRDEAANFTRKTLFADRAIEDQSPAALAAATERALDEADPEIVCITGWSHGEPLTMLRWAKRRGRIAILLSETTAHDARRLPWREAIKRWIVGLCDAALVGGSPQRAYVEALGMPPERVFIGYDAVDNEYFAGGASAARADAVSLRRRLGLPERYFLASCRFIEKKNLGRLLAAFAAYRGSAGERAWDLVLLGDGELRGAFEAQAAVLGVAGAVHFMGFRQYDDLPAFYGLAGGFVHVSTVEQWGLVVNEAMAAGLPVIVSRTCGCADDLVEHGANGWRVDPLDAADIAARLTELARPGTDRAALGARSREIVSAYGPERFADGLVRAIAAARGAPRKRLGPVSDWLLGRLAARNTRDAS